MIKRQSSCFFFGGRKRPSFVMDILGCETFCRGFMVSNVSPDTASPFQFHTNSIARGLYFRGCSVGDETRSFPAARHRSQQLQQQCLRRIDDSTLSRTLGFPPALGFPKHHPLPRKFMVAVDVDEVLGNFLSALNRFIADRYSLNHSVSEYHVYEFFKVFYLIRL